MDEPHQPAYQIGEQAADYPQHNQLFEEARHDTETWARSAQAHIKSSKGLDVEIYFEGQSLKA